jgi:hypothetical protein
MPPKYVKTIRVEIKIVEGNRPPPLIPPPQKRRGICFNFFLKLPLLFLRRGTQGVVKQ